MSKGRPAIFVRTVVSRIQASLGQKEQRDAAAYLVGTLVQRFGLLLLLPILLSSLSVAEYGAFGLVQSAVTLLPAVLTLNLPATVTRLYFDEPSNEGRKGIAAKLTVLCVTLGTAATILVFAFSVLARTTVASVLGLPVRAGLLISALVLAGALGSAMLQMGYGIWRAEHRPVRAVTATVSCSLLFLFVGIILHARGQLTLVSAVMAYTCTTLAVGLGASALAASWVFYSRGPMLRNVFREAVSYGLPVLPYLIGIWTLAAGGRWIGRATLGLEAVAQFTLASQIATMIGLIGRSSYEAWAPRSFALAAGGRSEDALLYLRARAGRVLTITTLAAIIAEVVIAQLLPKFAPSYTLVPWVFPVLAIGALLDVAYLLPHNVLMGVKRTRPIAKYTTVSVCSFLILGTSLSHFIGLWGLVSSYVFAYFLQWAQATHAARSVREVRLVPTSTLSEDRLIPP